ncbi:hypothetical protein SARC_06025 [Sphaeroforma arctica JP610]|uniref:Uncharacterized protein n=1 Tax=Sphaeroforma arctica JP610 TaxID=667725 RepID=A0A0L0FYN9_9EUKA|nr:hypothetical protein SARC_06025 [Sphaeroforma arctica JP610]KNC81671.1 hypothetical protein SARC_06025 [Sphaeroforma arctica JP610]|eukprot:XP_014155573.1 hypothetical protein SARC_06025 [Sphaeroforma arctica JP610]
MADAVSENISETIKDLNMEESIKETWIYVQEKFAEAAANAEADQGLYLAYGALLTMALIPIYFGCMLSLAPKSQDKKN